MSGPAEDALVGCHQLVALQGGGDDEAVGGVAVHARQEGCLGRDCAVDGDLQKAPVQKIAPLGVDVNRKIEVALLDTHSDLPYRYGRNGGVALLKRKLELGARTRPQSTVTPLMPDQNVSVEEDQKRSSPPGSSNHSAGIGATMSSRMQISSR